MDERGLTRIDLGRRGRLNESVPKRRNRTGCLTCRQRRKRCDGARDVCGHCTRLNLICHWQKPQDLIRAPASPQQQTVNLLTSPTTIRIAPAPIQFLQSDAHELSQRSLDRKLSLRYYIQTFNAMLTTNLENNGFLSVLLPMAIEEKALLDMIVAWSSSHLSLCDDVYRVKALEHRATALQSFTTSLLTSQESPELTLACCLVFCSMSAILGDTAGWHDHLVGAAQIIRHAGVTPSYQEGIKGLSSTHEGRWLLRNFAYHDILMSVTSDRAPLIQGRYWMSSSNSGVDSYVGLASEPLALISDISSLNGNLLQPTDTSTCSDVSSSSPSCDSDTTESSRPSRNDLSYRACKLEMELQDWACPTSMDPCLVNLAEAYRSAALIHLYRVMRRRIPSLDAELEHKIPAQVSAIVHHVGQMPLRCLPECTSLFPLFMAGAETRIKSVMQFVRERLQHIITYRHFQNAASALSVLEELWLQHTSITGLTTGEPLDWLDILQRRNWHLALS